MLRVGASSADITPPVGVELCGYGYYLRRYSTDVLDPLMARAVYVESDGGRVLFIGNDLIGVDKALTQRTRDLCHRHLGLPRDAIMLACTHTHSGPATIRLPACGEVDEAYWDHLPYAWLEVARKAVDAAAPATLSLARGPVEPVGYDRHDPEGPVDCEVRIARFDVDGESVALLVNHSAHGVVFGGTNTLISADWPGVLEHAIGHAFDRAVGIFVQGACGTVNVKNPCKGTDEGVPIMRETGIVLARAVVRLAREATAFEGDLAVSCARVEVPLPLDVRPEAELSAHRDACWAKYEDERLPVSERNIARTHANTYQRLLDGHVDGVEDTYPAEVQAFRIGPLRIVGVPGELFMALGQQIIDCASDGLVMVAGYANDFVGYLPTREAYVDARYEYPTRLLPLIVGRFAYQPGVGELITETAIDLCR
ncbi:MAG TPA: hypothetical protein PLO37_07165 [Candidatus Hydrogenedentes bacterium]|nr:hypothetical protein [Candidatus Hydrogenedentota bacterium]HPG66611.1 hypothetical protein [Candidatus Hydrogenedentota bacterium]